MELWQIAISVAGVLIGFGLCVWAAWWDYQHWRHSVDPVVRDEHDDWVNCPSCNIHRVKFGAGMCGQCSHDLNKGD